MGGLNQSAEKTSVTGDFTRQNLLEETKDAWNQITGLTTSISRIRSKIEADGGVPYIKTVYGMGYQWTGGEAK